MKYEYNVTKKIFYSNYSWEKLGNGPLTFFFKQHLKDPYHTTSPDLYKPINTISNTYCSAPIPSKLSQQAQP